jgi:hypothetical protein
MMNRPTRTLLIRAVLAIALLGVATPRALADRPPEHEIVDARLEGYKDNQNVTLEGGSTGLTWFLLVILGIIGTVGLFKDAKRSHLD